MPKGFYIQVTNNLLEKKHRKAMGIAVWEFMWFLDKITKIDEGGIGWVFGGKPMNLRDIADELGIHEINISKNLTKLEKAGYIHTIHTPHGMVVRVAKAKKRFSSIDRKWFSESAKPPPGSISENAKPNIRQYNTLDNTDIAANAAETFIFDDYVREMQAGQRHIQIIALHWKHKEVHYETLGQARAAIKRDLRSAKALADYSDERILDTMDHLDGLEYIKRWTLETVGKYIDRKVERNLRIRG